MICQSTASAIEVLIFKFPDFTNLKCVAAIQKRNNPETERKKFTEKNESNPI